MNLYEKLNRLDDSLVESERIVKKNLTESVSKEDLIQWLNRNAEREVSNEEFKLLVDDLWSVIEEENADLEDYNMEYESIDDVDVTQLIDSSDNPVHDIGHKLLGVYDDDDIEEMLTENRWNPYFTPYGYRDAAKVLNGKAPEYYYHLKEIEMDRGDGVRLARYAMRKGLPVMVDKNSDPDYPEFAIKDEYHWNDYFYPYPTAHEDNLIPWDGKMFTEQSLTEESTEQDILEDEWQLIKSDKTYDPEGLDIVPADEVLCSGTEEECREEFNKLVVKFKQKEKTENSPQLAKVYKYFIKIEKLTDDTLVVYYPQAQSKDVYRLRKVN